MKLAKVVKVKVPELNVYNQPQKLTRGQRGVKRDKAKIKKGKTARSQQCRPQLKDIRQIKHDLQRL